MKRVISITTIVILALVAIPMLVNGQDNYPNQESLRESIKLLVDAGSDLRLKFTIQAIDSSLQYFDSAYTLAVSGFGEKDTLAAMALYGKAACEAWKYNCARGYKNANRAVAIWENKIGPHHPAISYGLWVMGDYYVYWGKYAQAETAYLRGIKLLENNPGFDPHHLALLKNNLGNLYFLQENFEKAEAYLTEGLDIWTEVHGRTGWWVGAALGNLVEVYIYFGKYEKAEKYAHQAISIAEESMGANHWITSFAYSSLGNYLMAVGDYDNALTYKNKAMGIIEDIFGANDSRLTVHLWSLSVIEYALENKERAVDLAERATALGGTGIKGIYDPDAAFLASLLAKMYYSAGEIDKSYNTYSRVIDQRRKFIRGISLYASEAFKLRYIRHNPLIDHSYLSFALENQSNPILSSALLMILAGKSIVLDILSYEKETAFCEEDKNISSKALELSTICTNISNLTIIKPNIDNLNDSLENLYKSKRDLEIEISQLCNEFVDFFESDEFTIDDILECLHENSAMVEFVKYKPFNFEKVGRKGSVGEPRYLGVVITYRGDISFNDLGPAIEIDSMIAATHEHMRSALTDIRKYGENKAEKDLADITHWLYEKVFAPLVLGGYRQIYISPDGQLNLLPFEILVDSGGSYVVENYRISYLSTGRDLIKPKAKRTLESNSAVVMINPDYESTVQYEPAYLALSTDVTDDIRYRGPSDRTECLTALFNPLPATSTEGRAIADLIGQKTDMTIDYITGIEASESRLKNLNNAPSILHLATHGYYCSGGGFADYLQITENPLLYTGLALSGANRAITGELDPAIDLEDGILTSLEASGLDLYGTDLVILSACQTGLGEVANGEGVYGLRRAFQLAGANSIIMSMFNIPDQSTVSLMEQFYANWLSGNSKSTALRDASLAIIEERRQSSGAAHPLFWGGFILVGNSD